MMRLGCVLRSYVLCCGPHEQGEREQQYGKPGDYGTLEGLHGNQQVTVNVGIVGIV